MNETTEWKAFMADFNFLHYKIECILETWGPDTLAVTVRAARAEEESWFMR